MKIFVKLFETSFVSDAIASFTEFSCQGTDTFGFIRVLILKFTFKMIIYINNARLLL